MIVAVDGDHEKKNLKEKLFAHFAMKDLGFKVLPWDRSFLLEGRHLYHPKEVCS